MLSQEDLLYTLALRRITGIGDIIAKKLISVYGSAGAIFTGENRLKSHIDGIGEFTERLIYKELSNKDLLKQAETELRFIERNGIKVLYFMDDGYPELLKQCVDGPVMLFSKGNINLEKKRVISVVGTRNATSYGTSFCERLFSDLAKYNPTIVSGYAYGIDITAHKVAINNGLQTLACLAHGLNQTYPDCHKIYNLQVEANGGFLTDFWSTDGIAQGHFLSRNRIIAGISEALIVIESAKKGGALVTASIANSYNREVLCVPGKVTDRYSEGCNTLIKKNSAQMLTSAQDVVETLNWDIKKQSQKQLQKKLFAILTEEEQSVYTYLQKSGKTTLDTIAIETQIPVYKLSSILLDMELKDVVQPLPGKVFEAI